MELLIPPVPITLSIKYYVGRYIIDSNLIDLCLKSQSFISLIVQYFIKYLLYIINIYFQNVLPECKWFQSDSCLTLDWNNVIDGMWKAVWPDLIWKPVHMG